ncbi:hypothetical protein LCGC14_2071890, partial [marine sediment metagenome]
MKDTVSLMDVQEAIGLLASGDISVLFVDSLTKVYTNFVNEYKKKNNVTFMKMLDWAKVIPSWQEKLNDLIVHAKGNILFTGRGGFTYEKEKDEIDERTGQVLKKGAMVKTGTKTKLPGETPHEPDMVCWMEAGRDSDDKAINQMEIVKSRFPALHGKIISNPTYENSLKPLVDYMTSEMEIGDVSGATHEDSGAPQEDYSGYDRRDAKTIVLEKISGKFELLGLGTSKEDKAIKTAMYQQTFGTVSKTEIEKMRSEDVQHHGERMLELIDEFTVKIKDSNGEQWNPLDWISSWVPEPNEELFGEETRATGDKP